MTLPRLDFAHLHLVLTHFPPVLSLGAAASGSASVVVRRQRRDLMRLARLLLVFSSLIMPVTYFAGFRAADRIGRVDGVRQEALAPHQSAALTALVMSSVAGIVATAARTIERRRRVPRALHVAVVVAAVVAAAAIGWTAALGGAIHHPEIDS